ncbi:DUF1385 domain-containing protein [Maridesulfovibrio ferrireducens]|uniref:DUF1385 domain-containing protein n=1 Tax=Maridesulfovibrio ferrireducens TaxID=246191 RepID=UPI001A1EB4B8|nr:DUF1385 domain-containing protein [Maridesulfovibrio ferrireducens]MBI9111518.1 DUF1385 domain-containing protein [Maridesulfovibrio ferrireducens]
MSAAKTVGGQAVIEGVMMRAKDRLAIAVRRPDGEITVELRPWFSMTPEFMKKPFLRGFPIFIETMVNGVKALNYSATQALDEEDGELTSFHLILTMIIAMGSALGLFVVLPHFFSVLMKWWGISGDVDTLSFHVWDGFFKMAMFLGYIVAISFVPDIKRVFQYHGAEHKSIWAYESGSELTPSKVKEFSRLHPRCGTAFLLFVLVVSILLFTILVPLLLAIWSPQTFLYKHLYIVGIKLLLMAPVSAIAYEMIKASSKHENNLFCRAMCLPGLGMQLLTTSEPDLDQIEVALAALAKAVEEDGGVS